MSKGLAILHGVCMCVEEITDRWHNFITDQGIEMSKLDVQRLGAHLAIKLWHSQPIVAIGIPFRIKPTSNRIKKVSAIEQVDSTTQAQLVFLENSLIDEVQLIHLALPSTIIKGDRSVPISTPIICPNANIEPAIRFNTTIQ